MGLLSNRIWLRAGMTYEDLQNAIEQKDYKSEKQKTRDQKRLISAFASADKDNDNVLSKKEYISDGIKGGLVMSLGALVIGGATFKGVGALQAKMFAKALGPVIEKLDFGKIADDAIKNVRSNVDKLA